MARVYQIISQQPQIVLSDGVPQQGYVVRARLTQYDEMVEIQVRKLDPTIIDALIRNLLEARQALDTLGVEPED